MVDKVTVTNVLLINNCICNHYKKKKCVGAKKNKQKHTNEWTNKQATRERNIEVVMLQSTVVNTANFFFFSLVYYLTADQCDQLNAVIQMKETCSHRFSSALTGWIRVGLRVSGPPESQKHISVEFLWVIVEAVVQQW